MTALATLIAVAAWCGFPAYGGHTAAQIDQCRQEIMPSEDAAQSGMLSRGEIRQMSLRALAIFMGMYLFMVAVCFWLVLSQ